MNSSRPSSHSCHGCGRVYILVKIAVSRALQGVAAQLPAATRVFCGHEYTVSNLQFAKSVEPDSASVADKLDWSRKILANGGYTVPSTVSECFLLSLVIPLRGTLVHRAVLP